LAKEWKAAMFKQIEEINTRPEPFQFYTAEYLWTDEHTSAQMLKFHLDGEIDVSSRNTAFIDRSADWMVSRFGIGAGIKNADFGCGPGLLPSKVIIRISQAHPFHRKAENLQLLQRNDSTC
jgi:hypothetical protein